MKKSFTYVTKKKLIYRRGLLRCAQLVPVLVGLVQMNPAHAAPITSTFDLGLVSTSVNLNGTVTDSMNLLAHQTYTYQQLLVVGSHLDLMLDGGQTVRDVLANDLGAVDAGTLSYNFPLIYGAGASGTYAQTSTGSLPSTLDFVATSQSGTLYPTNTVGATIAVDLTQAATTYSTILDGAAAPVTNDFSPGSTTTVQLDLGTVTTSSNGNTYITTYVGEEETTNWQVAGAASPFSGVPEPSTVLLGLTGFGALAVWRSRRRGRA